MKAISVKDNGTPDTNWASLIEQGIKTIETRTWKTNYRGDLLICCSASSKSDNAGLAVCIVHLDDIVLMEKKHEKAACCKVYPRAQAWILSNLRPLARKFPVKGQLRLYEVEVD
jgi:hypothetical protein